MSVKSKSPIRKPIEQKIYAEFWKRFIAWCIDMFIVFLLANIFMFTLFWNIVTLFYLILFSLAYIIGFCYFFLLETYFHGQTLGKLIFQIRTVDEDTREDPSLSANVYNCLLKCLWITCFFDFLIGILKNYGDPRQKIRLMQDISNTVVINK